jgi:hypothetical protein
MYNYYPRMPPHYFPLSHHIPNPDSSTPRPRLAHSSTIYQVTIHVRRLAVQRIEMRSADTDIL